MAAMGRYPEIGDLEFLVTPQGVLGADSFTIWAKNLALAEVRARAKIVIEDWHSPNGWTILQKVKTFHEEAFDQQLWSRRR